MLIIHMRDYFYGPFRTEIQRCGTPITWDGVHDFLNELTTPEGKARFVLSLFMIIITDQAMHHYFSPEPYGNWRNRTQFPRFNAEDDFGRGNENPMKILMHAERHRLVQTDVVLQMLPEFVAFWIDEIRQLPDRGFGDVAVGPFFNHVTTDRDWQNAVDGQIALRLKEIVADAYGNL